ncbi:MAG TPA: hypothetical protein VMG62_03975 [Solirubrobacteraceae bacterium]|nr:hypothetical protein [Solirubrobacteraceae bacterium]
MTPRSVHSLGTAILSTLMALIGVALIVQALSAGALSMRLLLGALFLAAGLGRLYVEARRGRGTPRRR